MTAAEGRLVTEFDGILRLQYGMGQKMAFQINIHIVSVGKLDFVCLHHIIFSVDLQEQSDEFLKIFQSRMLISIKEVAKSVQIVPNL